MKYINLLAVITTQVLLSHPNMPPYTCIMMTGVRGGYGANNVVSPPHDVTFFMLPCNILLTFVVYVLTCFLDCISFHFFYSISST